MNNEPGYDPNSKNRSYQQWLGRETHRELIFPYPPDMIRQRLLTAFNSPITVSNGFLFAKYRYNGHVENDKVDVQFSVSGKNRMNYHLSGKLLAHPGGSSLKVTVQHETPLFFMIAFVLLAGFLLYYRHIPILFIIPIAAVFVATMAWHLSSAADNVCSMLKKTISGSAND